MSRDRGVECDGSSSMSWHAPAADAVSRAAHLVMATPHSGNKGYCHGTGSPCRKSKKYVRLSPYSTEIKFINFV